jgi:hypothetical protein
VKRRTIVTGGIGAAVLAAAAVGLSVGLPTGEEPAKADTTPQKTAKVTKQNLSDTETKNGTLGYGTATKINNKEQGTYTWVPAVGAVVERGQTLYKVDDLPVVAFYGTLPFYRPLSAGMTGNDVDQFAANLKALGYGSFTSSNIKKWQKKLGLSENGVVEPGRVAYVPEAIRIDSVNAAVGADAGQGEALSYTATKRVIVTTMEVNDSRLVKLNEKVKVTLPDNKTVDGTIVSSRTVVQAGQNGGESTTKLEATISLGETKVDYEQATVKVAFTASTRQNVLTVPVAALLALSEGGYGVELVEGSTRRIVTVQTGMFASGRVEISGTGLSDGMTVGMPS